MKDLEYKVGDILGIPTVECKFIVCKEDNLLKFYSAPYNNEFHLHKDIAAYNKIAKKNVLGGGKFKIENEVLKLYDYSSDFGAIPQKAAEGIVNALKNYLSGSPYDFKKVKNTIMPFYLNESNKKEWKKLGFEVK